MPMLVQMFLLALLWAVAAWLVWLAWFAKRPGVDAALLAGNQVMTLDLGRAEKWIGKGRVYLRDDEWGLGAAVDGLLRDRATGLPVPLEVKCAKDGKGPSRPWPSHRYQLGVAFLVCEADPRVGQRAAKGILRYVRPDGEPVPGGLFEIENSPELREEVLTVVQGMRQLLTTGVEVHRSHAAPTRCMRCSVQHECTESLAARSPAQA
jgi:CRISPR/Cas system-associated exonuclease Cas4 (RecB family)